AREIATAWDLPLRLPSAAHGARVPLAEVAPGEPDRISVTIEDQELCPRYAAAIADVVETATPGWMRDRLEAAGVRPISPIVDVTNYVLMELGHPMHAFDMALLEGAAICVRRAQSGEKITTIDGTERALSPEM